MNISKQHIEDFKQIWEENYNQKLTDEEAEEYSRNLLNFFKVLIKIDLEKSKKHQ